MLELTEEYILLLNSCFYEYPRLIYDVCETYKNVQDFKNGFDDFFQKRRFKKEALKKLKKRHSNFNLLDLQNNLNDKNIKTLFIHSLNYPKLLKEIPYPPLVLFYKGNPEYLSFRGLAIVGPREPSDYGTKCAQALSKELAQHFIIISGMAIGIDSIAHMGALNNGKPTIAVLGHGLDYCYPPENKNLCNKIINNGVVLTEFPLKSDLNPFHFPQRNRIISGLAKGVLVIEAKEKSGALITAKHAYETNREVFAVPGSILSETSKGTNNLIRDGAKLVQKAHDIITEFPSLSDVDNKTNDQNQNLNLFNNSKPPELNEKETIIWNTLNENPIHVDDIAIKTNQSIPEILKTLSLLEVNGHITQLPGKLFKK